MADDDEDDKPVPPGQPTVEGEVVLPPEVTEETIKRARRDMNHYRRTGKNPTEKARRWVALWRNEP